MTDKEMLELAAEAMGYGVTFVRGEKGDCCIRHGSNSEPSIPWNPLTHRADTAEMCAALELDHQWWDRSVCMMVGEKFLEEPHDNTTQGKLAAWMRAATRAAAEVARVRRKG